MFAYRIDFGNRRSGMDKHAISRNQVVKGYFLINGLLDNRRPSSADQEQHQSGSMLRFYRTEYRGRRLHRLRIWRRMSAVKITKSGNLKVWLDRTRNDTLECRAHFLTQSLDH